MIEDAGLSQPEAEEKAASDHALLFPDDALQPNHQISVLENENGERVGHLWWAKRQPPGTTATRACLYDIVVNAEYRGHGFGRAAMQRLEEEVREQGLPGIDLNVWGGNEVARSRYRSLGYGERAVFMSKELE